MEGRATLLDRLEEQVNKTLMKDKCNILYLGKHNPGLYHGLGSTQLRGSSVETDLVSVLVDKQLEQRLREDFITMSQYL